MICLKCGIRFANGKWNFKSGALKPPWNTEADRKMLTEYCRDAKGICAECKDKAEEQKKELAKKEANKQREIRRWIHKDR